MRDGFVFYRSFADAVKGLDDATYREVVDAITWYALDGETAQGLSPVAQGYFCLIRPQIDANNARYNNGCKGGRPKKETEIKLNENQTETKQKPKLTKAEPKEKEKDKDIYKEKENIKEKEIDSVLDEAMKNFERHRRQMKAPLTDRARVLALSTLEKLAPGDTDTKVKIIDQSIERGWKGLFPLKDEQAARPTTGITRGTDYDALIRRIAR